MLALHPVYKAHNNYQQVLFADLWNATAPFRIDETAPASGLNYVKIIKIGSDPVRSISSRKQVETCSLTYNTQFHISAHRLNLYTEQNFGHFSCFAFFSKALMLFK